MRLLVLITLFCLTLGFAFGAEVRIRGLQTMTETEALDTMGGRLTFIKSRPPSAARADDAAFIMEGLLRSRGFNNAEVTWALSGNKTIVLTVARGAPSILGSIVVKGMPEGESADMVAKQFQSAHDAGSKLHSKTPYLPNKNETGVTNAKHYLLSIGYWDAVVTLSDANRDPETGLINIALKANPGPLYRLALPRVEIDDQAQALPQERLSALAGKTATTAHINTAHRYVEEYFYNQGYQLATIEMSATHTNGILNLLFTVEAGRQYTVGEIKITGTENVNPGELDRRFQKFRGQKYRGGDIDDEIRKLYGTGAFEGIQLTPVPQEDGTLDLTIKVEESKPSGYFAYGGVGSLEGPILGGGYYHRNLMGRLWNFSTSAEISAIGLFGDVRVTEPWFLDRDLRFTARAYTLTRDYDGYDKNEVGIGAELAWDIRANYAANLSFYSSFISASPDGVASSEMGITDYFIHRLALTQTLDHRDNATLPTDGYFARLNNELGISLGGDSVSYFRTDAGFSVYQPILKKSHLAFNTRASILMPASDSTDLPIDLRYFLGGASTVRSFPERELGPSSNGYPRGGEAYWLANLEYIHTLKGLLKGVAFVDAGNLNESFEDFGSGRTNFAAGLGLRLNLPIGPVRLEYGHNLNPGESDPSGAFHFAIGTTF